MADSKISQLTALVAPASGDLIPIVDVSDTTQAASGSTKKITLTNLTSLEATIRAAADVALQTNIDAEANARAGDDNALQTDIDTRLKKDGTVVPTANLPMGAFKLTGLAAGSGAGDSVRYEQAILASGVNAFGADQSLGGFKLTNVATPTLNGDAANRGYVLGLKVTDLTAPTTSFSMNSQKITSLLDPSLAQDAVTLLYMKKRAVWDTASGASDFTMDADNTFVSGTDSWFLMASGSSITGSRIWEVQLTSGYVADFTIHIPNKFTISAGNTLTIKGDGTTLKILGPGTYYSMKFRLYFADSDWRISEEYSYGPSSSIAGNTAEKQIKWLTVTYDFAVHGGAIATVSFNELLPSGAILLRPQAVIETVTPFVSAGAATIAWGYTGVTDAINTATSYGTAPYTAANYVAVGLGSAPTTDKVTAVSNVTMTIAGAVVTAGKANLHLPYIINKF